MKAGRRWALTVPGVIIWLTGIQLATGPALAAATAAPADCAETQRLRWRGGSVRLENDLFAGTDRNYTSGVGFTLVSHDLQGRLRDDCLPAVVAAHARLIRWLDADFWRQGDDETAVQNLAVRFGQAMYTPADRQQRRLIKDDRPYAGLLYLGLVWNRRSHPRGASWERLDVRALNLGVIGPWALARESQNAVHRLRGIERFRGWRHQLRNEPAFQFSVERRFKPYVDGAVKPGWGQDWIASMSAHVGNIETAAGGGLGWRAGWNIPDDFGSYPIRPGAESRPPSEFSRLRQSRPQSRRAPRAGAHVFANVDARAVLHDFSLDGNLWRSSHSVSRRPWVAQGALGLSVQGSHAGRGLRFAVMRVWRTREFREQQNSHAFGSLTFSIDL